MTDWLDVGKIVNTHGVRGEVRIISQTDFPERRYAPGSSLSIRMKDGSRRPVEVKSHRPHKQFDLLTFKGYDSITEAEILKESMLQIHKDQLGADELDEGEYYYFQITGLEVWTDQKEYIGKIKEIMSPGANDVWVVQREGQKDLLLPYIDDVVKQIDLERNFVIITPMEGLLDL
ncbi:ribosome maturation factor RimM [Alkalicoccus chagannorensis]|uniref:ribosome maturation factor RimM n=1 Tax=Alkalicoccus chagannorensis TaxID=427072 RepID=UPI00041ACA62|nr:ribosome maturation factor RimM [Alkalicoccus chagannorensis]